MIFSLITLGALAVTVSMLIDLKIDYWEWTQRQRQIFAAIGLFVAAWSVSYSAAIWLHLLTVALMTFGIILVYRAWRRHRHNGRHFAFLQLIARLIFVGAAGVAFTVTVWQSLTLIGAAIVS